MFNPKVMMEVMFKVMSSGESRFPGADITVAEELMLGLCVYIYMAEDGDQTLTAEDLYDILGGKWYDDVTMKLGRAYGAALQVNKGNKYAMSVIAETLSGYNGKEIPQGIASLLNILEGFLTMREKENKVEH